MSDTTQNIIIRRLQANGQFEIYYPQTLADAVLTKDGNIKSHFTDAVAHVTTADKTLLGTVLSLDASGNIDPKALGGASRNVTKEFATIAARDADTAPADGAMVMVVDATGDTTVKSGWAMYRTVITAGVAAYVKFAEKTAMDYLVKWDALEGKPTSTPTAIDQLVTDAHQHGTTVDGLFNSNKALLDSLTDTKLQSLGSKDSTAAIDYGTTMPASAATGDMFYQVTGTTDDNLQPVKA